MEGILFDNICLTLGLTESMFRVEKSSYIIKDHLSSTLDSFSCPKEIFFLLFKSGSVRLGWVSHIIAKVIYKGTSRTPSFKTVGQQGVCLFVCCLENAYWKQALILKLLISECVVGNLEVEKLF